MKILFQGDSITDAGRRKETNCLGTGYPVMISGELGAHYPGKYSFVNKGISGNRIVDVYARMKKDILNLDPSFMTILIGINDVWHEIGEGNGVDAVKFERVYDWLITELKEAKPDLQILILEPFVLKGPATEHAWEEFWSETLLRSAACKRLAEKHGLVFIPLQEKLEQLADATSTTYVLGDGVHPTYAGHELISREVYKVYQNLL